MIHRTLKSKIRSLLPVLLVSALMLPATNAAGQTQLALHGTSDSDLLLYWEEKELYVQTATRSEKPLTQTAENMTVISAKEIEDMNAHSVSEVLTRVPGLFVDFAGQDFNGPSLLHMQGSSERLVTVLLDGVTWNFLSGSNADTSSIPVRIIDRIEIIKGPASSAWGSALGGVVNIITKAAGDSNRPKGVASASYGEANSQEYNGELYGKVGMLGYYLYGGRQQTDGLRNSRASDQSRFYAKLNLTPTRDLSLLFTTGYSDPAFDSGTITGGGVSINNKIRNSTYFATGGVDYRISTEWSLKAAAHLFQQKNDSSNTFTSAFMTALPGDFFKGSVYDEQTVGGSLKLIYSGSMNTAVIGMDASHGTLDQTTTVGPLYQSLGMPASSLTTPIIDKWAIFANDTLEFGPLAVTPGVRLDHDNVSGYFVSPSMGATYELGERTVARASVARGFTSPPLSYTSGGGMFLVPNPGLKREDGWSYQLGLESAITEYANAKVTLFRHDTRNAISDSLNTAKQVTNSGDVVRQGYELEAETVPLYNVSLKAAHAYAHIDADSAASGKDNYSYLVGLKYDDRSSLTAQLTGAYIWMTQAAASAAKYDTFIWDFNITKRFRTSATTSVDLFATVHNLFSGAHYTNNAYPNALRWVEGGLRFRF